MDERAKNSEDLFSMGKSFAMEKNYEKALKCFRKALAEEKKVSSKEGIYKAHFCLTTLFEEIGDFKKALYHCKKCHNVEKERLFQEIARMRQAKKSLEKANKKLKALLSIDPLTGVANRRGFNRVLSREWRRAVRDRTPLSLILIDVDFFKEFNDNQGHLAGDKCLMQIACTLADTVKRPGDFVARFGGEEFVVILPNTSSRGARLLAEQMRKRIESLEIIHKSLKASKSVTISLGTATVVPSRNSSPEELFNAADKALYRSKREGRNRVSSA